MKLLVEAIGKFLLGVLLVGILLFLPAGTFRYPDAWMFMAVLFVPMFLAGLIMWVRNPTLLRSRLEGKEKQTTQKKVVGLSGLMFLMGFVLAGLDYRFGWSSIPRGLQAVGLVCFLTAYLFYAEVLRENTYLSRTIKVVDGQTVIDSGVYGIIRHPMYSATLFLFLSMPIILGSLYSFLVFLVYPFLIVQRIKQEEKLLLNELSGYSSYCKKVRYRLFPYIW